MNTAMMSNDEIVAKLTELSNIIFERTFECRIRQLYLYDLSYIERVGMPSSGMAWLDQEMDNQYVEKDFTINEMTDLIKDGKPFHLLMPQKYSGIVYKHITEYVELWVAINDRLPNIQLPDQEDFEALDATAKQIYELYRCYEEPVELTGLIGRLRAKRSRLFGKRNEDSDVPPPLVEGDEIRLKQHESLLDAFGYKLQVRKAPKLCD
ncbi:hypothetical protein [Proteus mirabilis]|uniref:hypothetical protein n=1 Tax=Proteus mirabilis TaxID=584 RepID=UPI0034D437DE